MKPSAQMTVTERKTVRIVEDVAIEVRLPLPASLLREFNAYCGSFASLPWPSGQSERIAGSIRITLKARKPFNRPSNGIGSTKARLPKVLAKLGREEIQEVSLVIQPSDWAIIQAHAAEDGISEMELCLCAVDYHAALWRREQERQRVKSPLERFDRALARDHRRARAIA